MTAFVAPWAIAAYGPIGLIVVGGAGVVLSGADFVHTWQVIKNETGFTPCTMARLLLDVTGMVLGGLSIYKGIQAWRASGSLLRWVSPPVIGRAALNELYSQSQPGRGWDVREVYGENAVEWFYNIADPSTVEPFPQTGGVKGQVPGGGTIYYRPVTASGSPALEINGVPGYPRFLKFHFVR